MIDEWKRDRSKLDAEMDDIRRYLEKDFTEGRVNPARVRIRILLNELAKARMVCHRRIREYEEQERLDGMLKEIPGMSEERARELMRGLEKFKAVVV